MQKQQILQQGQQMGLAQSFSYIPHQISQQKRLRDYILLTYRSGIVPIQKTTYYTSDSGWGCMLRTAQMFIANLIHSQQPQFSVESIVRLFYDNLMLPFSIQNMTRVSKEIFTHMKPYDWYTPCQAGFLVKAMLEKFDVNYKVKICNDGAMFLEDITKEDQHFSSKEDTKNVQKSIENQSSKIYPVEPSKKQTEQQRIIVLLMARIGLDHSQPPYIRCVTKFMQNKYFASIMGGTPKHAHLIVDYDQGYFGYIDPHTTRPVIPDCARISDYIDQYTSKPLWLKQSKIDSSMCIGFCFRKSETQEFWKSMLEIKSQLKEDFFVYIDEKRPQFDENCIIQIHDFSDDES